MYICNCNQTETIEHLIYSCEEYSAHQWTELGQSLTHVIIAHTRKAIPTLEFTPLENKIQQNSSFHQTTHQRKANPEHSSSPHAGNQTRHNLPKDEH